MYNYSRDFCPNRRSVFRSSTKKWHCANLRIKDTRSVHLCSSIWYICLLSSRCKSQNPIGIPRVYFVCVKTRCSDFFCPVHELFSSRLRASFNSSNRADLFRWHSGVGCMHHYTDGIRILSVSHSNRSANYHRNCSCNRTPPSANRFTK